MNSLHLKYSLSACRAANKLDVVVFEHNIFAHGLYVRLGFVERDHRPIAPHPSLNHTDGDAILMVKDL